jgi:protein-disulfide isomerase
MKSVLPPGILAPQISSLAYASDRYMILVVCPSRLTGELEKYHALLSEFQASNINLVVLSDAPTAMLGMIQVSDIDAVAQFGARAADGALLPIGFILDEEHLIRRVFEPIEQNALPNPAAVLRAARGLVSTTKPSPITETDWRWGPSRTSVVVIEYSDYQCSHCAQAHAVLNEILPTYQDRVCLVHRHYPLNHSHPFAQLAAEAAEAAGAQGKFWEMHHALFAHSHELTNECIQNCAAQIGLDVERFTRDLETHQFESVVNAAAARARAEKIKFPPVLFINRILFEGARTRETLTATIDRLLANS